MNKKKIIKIILILFLIICPYIVNAATYDIASDPYYKDTISKNEELLEEEVRYKFYKETKIYSNEYYIENNNETNFPYRTDDYITTEYTEYSKTYPKEVPNRIIKSREMFLYKTLKKIRYIYLKDIKGSNGYLRINELNIFNNNNPINYKIECKTCENITNLNDNILENSLNVRNATNVIIDLQDYYNIEDLNMNIYLSDNYGTELSTFRLDAEEDNYIDILVETNMYTKNKNSYKLSFNLIDYIKEEKYNDKVIYSEEEINNKYYYLIDRYKEYSYRDIKYLYYRLERTYLDDYYKEKEGYIKDESDSKIFYKVRYKNKIILKDDYIIKSYNYNLYDMIEDTTIDINRINISSNIDITKNGIYKVTFSYNNFSIDKYVIVDIEEMMESIDFSNNSTIKKAEKITHNNLINNSKNKKDIHISISLILMSFIEFIRINMF